jgi:drug/metabolite transporter (DMT)-like permease
MAEIYPKLSFLPLGAATPGAEDGGMTHDTAAYDTAAGRRSRLPSWIALGVVYLAWGSTYLAIRVGVGHLPPFFLAGIRYVIAGTLLYPIGRWAAARGRGPGEGSARPGWKAWLAGAVIGILLLFAGNGGVTVAETSLPSGLAAVLVATVPLWMIVFAWPVQGQRVTGRSAAVLVVGLAGVAILAGGSASGRVSGVLIVLGAAAAWGFGSVLGHRLPLPPQAMLAAAIEMLAGGAVLLAVAAGTGEFGRIGWASVPASSWLALAYLVVPGSILAFTAYGYALARLPLATVSTYAYVNPVVAVLAGIVVLGEKFTWREGLGAALVVASVVIIVSGSRAESRVASRARAPELRRARVAAAEHLDRSGELAQRRSRRAPRHQPSATTSGNCADSRNTTSAAASPTRSDQSSSPRPRTSASASLTGSRLSSGQRSAPATAAATVDLPVPGEPDTTIKVIAHPGEGEGGGAARRRERWRAAPQALGPS